MCPKMGLPNLENVNWEFRNGIGLFFYNFISAECVVGIQERGINGIEPFRNEK
jgi:hypothetical protein